jgi:hypothetical protein
MANANAPRGLQYVGTVGGYASGAMEVFTTPAGDGTAIYIGDPVTKTANGTGQTVNGVSYPDCVIAATTDIIDGVVVAVLADTEASLPYRAASTLRRLLVCTDPNALYEAQEGTSGTAFTENDVGNNVSLSIVAGSTVTGLSGTILNNATENTTNTLVCKMVRMVNRPNLSVGYANRWIVRINRHRLVDQLIGV